MDTVGVNVIETAALGRPFQLGMLYDCRKDTLIPGITLWDPEKLQQSLRVRPQINTDFNVKASDSIEDKSSLLNIDGSLKLSVLGGLINVTGSAKYLNDTKKSFKQQRLTLHYHSTSRFEELTMNHLAPADIVHHEVFDNDTATHVVTAVLYGADACFVFDREVSSDEEIKTVEGQAKVALEKLKCISVDVNVNLKMDDIQKNAVKKFTCTFYGDFQLPSNPTSFEDALKVFSDLPKLLGEKKELAVPLRVWLYPLDKLLSRASKLQKDISMDLIIKTESAIESLNTTEMKCNDLLKDLPASTFAEFQDKILQIKQNCYMYKLKLMKKLGSLLPNIRGDVMKETDLNDLLQEHNESPFSGRDLAEWLKERERESAVIKVMLRQLEGVEVENNIDAIWMDLEVGNLVCYMFTSLNWLDVLLHKQSTYLSMSAKGEINENSPDSEQKSWLTPVIHKTMRTNLMIFKNLMDSKDRKPAKFIVSSKEMKNNPGSCILLYESECDEAVCFIPPSQPACPITEEVKENSLVLKVPPSCPATVELRLLYKRKQDTLWTSKPVMKDELTVTLTDLREETEYEIKCAALGKLNYTVDSDVISVTTEGRGSLSTDIDFEGEYQSIPSTCSDVRWSPGAPQCLYRGETTVLDPCGLINQGMTCYLNAVLQTLFMTDDFRDRVLRLRDEVSGKSSKGHLLKALADLFWSLQHERTAVSTREVTKALNISNVREQQDAAEYLQMILHRVPEPSEIFRGISVTSTVCSCCIHNNEEETDFVSIPLSIDDRGTCDVNEALMEYLGIHDMSGEDQLFCVTCDSMRDMETRNDIKKWPDILTLQLKRFEMEFIRNKLHYWKNECKVNIPPNLQVHSVMYESSPQYELYAIINHYGSLVNGGRNDAVIKDEKGNWYHFNDQTVTKIHNPEPQKIPDCSTSAYLLMYRKVTEEAAAPGRDERSKTHTNEGRRSNDPQLKNPDQHHPRVKSQPMISPKSRKQSHSSVSESSSKMLKLRLKEEFQYLKEDKSPGERRRLLNHVFIEPHITEEQDSHTRDKRLINIFEGQNIRTVLMKGEAGIGKSVTVQKFILDWAEEKSNPEIEYVLLIPFQKLNIIKETVKECSFMELLQRCFKNTEHLKPTDSDRIMLIFDGLHEFKLPLDFKNTKSITDPNKPASVSDLLINLIMGNLLPNAQIWITSRPAAANQIPAEYIDRVTEIQGFNDEQKEEYFRKSISDPIMANKVLSHIQKSPPRINSMCYSPDYCRIIAAIPEEMIRTGSDFPETLTQMYSRFLLAQTEPNREKKKTIIALGKIAFDLLVNGSFLFSDEDLKKCGIRDESDVTNSLIIKVTEDQTKSFCFMNHRTQEFLAALYVTEIINGGNTVRVRDLSSLKLEFGELSFTDYSSLGKVLNIALQKQMDLFFCFLLGLTLESSQRALKDLLTQRRSRSSSSQDAVQHIKTMIMNSSSENAVEISLLFDALRELDDRYLIHQIKTHLKSGLRLSPAEFSALMIVLLNPEQQLDQISSIRRPEASTSHQIIWSKKTDVNKWSNA